MVKNVLIVSTLIILLMSCQKEVLNVDNEQNITPKELVSQNVSNTSNIDTSLSYGATIFYLKNQSGDYSILPVSKPASSGYFKSIPVGLNLDSATGKINVTQSQTGLRYKIFYVSTATNLHLDSVKIIISGVDYADSIFRINNTTNTYDTSFPIYNANPQLALPCNYEDDDEDDTGCIFDETDLNGDGNDDIPGVIQDKFLIDRKRGTIDVEASFHAGIFGSSNPSNGLTKDFTFYYRLTDASNRALNKITVRVYHYTTMADIPQWLIDELNARKNRATQINSLINGNTNSDVEEGLLYNSFKKRPPIIIIVSS